jgi:hypothetical protein
MDRLRVRNGGLVLLCKRPLGARRNHLDRQHTARWHSTLGWSARTAVRLEQGGFMKFSSIFLPGFTRPVQIKSTITVRFTVP